MTPNHCTWDTQCMLKGALSFCKRWVGLPAQPRGALQRLVPDALPHCLVRSGFSCEDHRFLGICLNGNGVRVTLPMDFGSRAVETIIQPYRAFSFISLIPIILPGTKSQKRGCTPRRHLLPFFRHQFSRRQDQILPHAVVGSGTANC